MGLCFSRPEVVEGAIIVDSVVISNSRVSLRDNVLTIPFKSLESGESSVMTIDRKAGVISITRGAIHGTLTHDALIEDMRADDKKDEVAQRESRII